MSTSLNVFYLFLYSYIKRDIDAQMTARRDKFV